MAARALSNKFCRSTDLSNEASVEAFFVSRLLGDLGYADEEILPKKSIQELKIPRGRKKEPFRPDYLLRCVGIPRWIIDAKSTTERIEDFAYQCAGYALLVNRKFEDNPCRYFMLTNGLLTRVYVWDQEEPILSLRFSDFKDRNARYRTLKKLLGAETVRQAWPDSHPHNETDRLLVRPAMDEVKRAFLRCHRIIWKSEKKGPQAAFVEFAKLLFVKLWEDRKIRDDPSLLSKIGKGEPLPGAKVRFSVQWVENEEANDPHPVNSLLFRQLVDTIEHEIAQRKRKRIFEQDERLRLSPGTAKRVVAELEDYYLFGIDEDLNGRMFEAFLAATMRGQDLGQYFTPRSVVKMITRLADLKADRERIERIIDGCCGTGGFLIEALTEMRRQVWDNKSLTKSERDGLLDEVANEAIFGIDAGSDPTMARIARINMYLHGDGGSRVYMTDALRHPPEPSDADSVESKQEVLELASVIGEEEFFDVVLTNPPFSMDYSMEVAEEREVIETYELRTYGGKNRSSLRSSVMFLERYCHLLKPGGRLLTVIDDSVLSGKQYGFVRDYIREKFVVRAIISLHGDAFQRAGARAKTSILYLVKRESSSEDQPDVFVYESRYIGLDDVVPRTRKSVADLARESAAREMDEIAAAFNAYRDGKSTEWLVSADKIGGRLDAKFLRPWSVDKLKSAWDRAGIESAVLADLVEPVEEHVELDPDERYTFLRISYEGRAEHGDSALGKEVSYSKIGRAQPGDIVVSNISAVYRAICVLPEEFAHLLTSNEFTVLRRKKRVRVDAHYLWSVLRSPAVIAEWISASSGVGRHRVDWSILEKQQVPLLPFKEQKAIGDKYRKAMQREDEIRTLTEDAVSALAALNLDAQEAKERLEKAKPPK